jgi:hypothetical protein
VNRDRIAAWFEATGFAAQSFRIWRNESPELRRLERAALDFLAGVARESLA